MSQTPWHQKFSGVPLHRICSSSAGDGLAAKHRLSALTGFAQRIKNKRNSLCARTAERWLGRQARAGARPHDGPHHEAGRQVAAPQRVHAPAAPDRGEGQEELRGEIYVLLYRENHPDGTLILHSSTSLPCICLNCL